MVRRRLSDRDRARGRRWPPHPGRHRAYFIATKLEAFAGRGHGDYQASHDLEDIIAIVDGREAVVNEIHASDDALREYLAAEVTRLLSTPAFVDALPGHLRGDSASQARLPLVQQRLRDIAAGAGQHGASAAMPIVLAQP